MESRKMIARLLTVSMILLCIGIVAPLHAQVGTSSVNGLAEDTTQARIPGVEVTATNLETGIETVVLTNDAGAYNIPNLQAGAYTVRAVLPGFQTQVFENVTLVGNDTRQFNFTLEVAAVATAVEVTLDAQQLLTQTGATVGDVLPDYSLRSLPLVGNDVLDLVNVLGGVSLAGNQGNVAFGDAQEGGGSRFTTLAGVSATYVNTTINGVSVTDDYYAGVGEPDNTSGIMSVTRINPELIQEVRLILTPVDAALGRGNGQVQLTTRSGTNDFRGTARWDIRNPALDARSWNENRLGTEQNWFNQNQGTLAFGGPIVRNRTFFFALWDQNQYRERTNVNNTVLTPCARNGVYRYFPNWVNGNSSQPAPVLNGAPNLARAAVDGAGNSVMPTANPDGSPYTESLRYFSVFGPIDPANMPSSVAADCSNIPVLNGSLAGASSPATAWDANRWSADPTGFVSKVLNVMPQPNNYDTGDGLNTAGNRYIRRRNGVDGGGFFGSVGTTSDRANRKQINIKVDHQFNQDHKLAVQWSYERDSSQAAAPAYEEGFWGSVERRPQIFSANFNSTLSPTMVNEFILGIRRTNNSNLEAIDTDEYGEATREFFPSINGIPAFTSLAIVGNPMMRGNNATNGNRTRQFVFSDKLSWTMGAHSFRFGGEIRRAEAIAFENLDIIPRVSAGAGSVPVAAQICNCDFEDLIDADPNYGNGDGNHFQSNNLGMLENLLLLQSGSIGEIVQHFFVQDINDLDNFQSYSTDATKQRDWRQNEAAFYVQDDWKVTRDLTLNLGVRWEYYGPPHEAAGLLPTGVGSSLNGVFGISGDNWDDAWWQSDPNPLRNYPSDPTVMEFIGPNSPNPNRSIYPRDMNNFGPVIGFAWNVPWFGAGQTVVRGGYSVTFQGGGNMAALDGTVGAVPGAVYDAELDAAHDTFFRLADFGSNHSSLTTPATFDFRDYPHTAVVPLPEDTVTPGVALRPMNPIPPRNRVTIFGPIEFLDDTYVAPYVQNFNLTVTRNLSRNMTLDVSYVGTVARKLFTEAPVNSPNFLTNGLKAAFDAARAGGESQLLDDLTTSVNGAYGGSGAEWLRNQTVGGWRTGLANNLASGDYALLARGLAWTNGTRFTGGVAPRAPGEDGAVLHNSFSERWPNGVPDNFISANPQFGSLNIVTNQNSTNYHSLQTKFTLRPTYGINYQGTFTWSKMLGSPTAVNTGGGRIGFFNPGDRQADYGLQFQHRTLDFRSHGTFVLPIGPGKPFLGNTDGWVARALEEWQFSAIFQMTTGMPMSIVARNGLFEGLCSCNFGGTNRDGHAPPDVTVAGDQALNGVRGIGEVTWQGDVGTYFGDHNFTKVADPQCLGVADAASGSQTLRQRCMSRLRALALDGSIVMQNPAPGTFGNLGFNTLEGPGMWALDASLSKSFQIGENRRFQVRFDATNIFNHPQPNTPSFYASGFFTGGLRGTNLALNNPNDFGRIGVKNGLSNRRFQATLRMDF